MSMLYKVLKIILISFFSINFCAFEIENFKCDADFESISEKKICIRNLENNEERKVGLMNTEKLSKFHQVSFNY